MLCLCVASKNGFFQAVVQEIRSRRPLVQAVQEAGHSLVRRPRTVCCREHKNDASINDCGLFQVRGRHFASHDIQERLEELKMLHEELTTEAAQKEKLLQEALSIYTFLTKVSSVLETVCVCVFVFRHINTRMSGGVGARPVDGGAEGGFRV